MNKNKAIQHQKEQHEQEQGPSTAKENNNPERQHFLFFPPPLPHRRVLPGDEAEEREQRHPLLVLPAHGEDGDERHGVAVDRGAVHGVHRRKHAGQGVVAGDHGVDHGLTRQRERERGFFFKKKWFFFLRKCLIPTNIGIVRGTVSVATIVIVSAGVEIWLL